MGVTDQALDGNRLPDGQVTRAMRLTVPCNQRQSGCETAPRLRLSDSHGHVVQSPLQRGAINDAQFRQFSVANQLAELREASGESPPEDVSESSLEAATSNRVGELSRERFAQQTLPAAVLLLVFPPHPQTEPNQIGV